MLQITFLRQVHLLLAQVIFSLSPLGGLSGRRWGLSCQLILCALSGGGAISALPSAPTAQPRREKMRGTEKGQRKNRRRGEEERRFPMLGVFRRRRPSVRLFVLSLSSLLNIAFMLAVRLTPY